MFEQVTNSGRAEADTVSRFDSDGAIRRYQQIQQEIARLEEERERIYLRLTEQRLERTESLFVLCLLRYWIRLVLRQHLV